MNKATIEQVRSALEACKVKHQEFGQVPAKNQREIDDWRLHMERIEAALAALAAAESEPIHRDVSQDGGNTLMNACRLAGLDIETYYRIKAYMPVAASQPEAPVLTDAQIDIALDRILHAAGSALKHYSMQKTIDDMRNAMRIALSAHAQAAAEPRVSRQEVDAMRDILKDMREVSEGVKALRAECGIASPDAQAIREAALEALEVAFGHIDPGTHCNDHALVERVIGLLKSQAPQPAQDPIERDQWKQNDAQACAIRDVAMEEIAHPSQVKEPPVSLTSGESEVRKAEAGWRYPFMFVVKDKDQLWLEFDGGTVCLNNIAEDRRGPIVRRAMLDAISAALAQSPARQELNAFMLQTLQQIVDADWHKWEELASPEEFVRWAKSRAMHAISKAQPQQGATK